LDGASTYQVAITGLPAGYMNSTGAGMGCPGSNDDSPGNNGISSCYDPSGNDNDTHIDFGIVPGDPEPDCESVSGTVFSDDDNDGCQDTAGYSFGPGSPAGDLCLDGASSYQVAISGLPLGYTNSTGAGNGCPGSADDSPANDGVSDCYDPSGNDDDTHIDFGVIVDEDPCYSYCNGQAGSIMFTNGGNYGNSSYVCYGDQAVVDADDFLLSPCQSVYYVYHTVGPDITAADLPLADADVITYGSFITNDAGKSVIYVTAFGAQSDGSFGPDYSDPCLTIANTLVINFLDPITVEVDELCDNSTGEFFYDFTVTGGLTECVPGATYNVSGAYWNGPILEGETISVGPISDGEFLNFTISDSNGCSADYSDLIQCIKLPIELISLEGRAIETGNLVLWETGSEINNDFFTVSRSEDGVEFREIEIVAGAGTTNTAQQYSILDTEYSALVNYYELKQTDFDGTEVVVGVVRIKRDENVIEIIELAPVPVIDVLNIEVSNKIEDVVITVYNSAGQLILQDRYVEATNLFQVDLTNAEAGVYMLEIISDNTRLTEKLIVR